MNKKHIKSYIIIVTSIIFIFFTVGCTSDTEYKPPSEVETTSDTQEKTTANTEEKPTEKPSVHIFNVGDTAIDDELKYTQVYNNEKEIKLTDIEISRYKQTPHHRCGVVDLKIVRYGEITWQRILECLGTRIRGFIVRRF